MLYRLWFSVFSVLALTACAAVPKDERPAVATPTIPQRTFSLTTFGGVGDGKTLRASKRTS